MTIRDAIKAGTPEQVAGLVARLRERLPGYSMTAVDETFDRRRKAVEELQRLLAAETQAMREAAERVADKVEWTWGPKAMAAALRRAE